MCAEHYNMSMLKIRVGVGKKSGGGGGTQGKPHPRVSPPPIPEIYLKIDDHIVITNKTLHVDDKCVRSELVSNILQSSEATSRTRNQDLTILVAVTADQLMY